MLMVKADVNDKPFTQGTTARTSLLQSGTGRVNIVRHYYELVAIGRILFILCTLYTMYLRPIVLLHCLI